MASDGVSLADRVLFSVDIDLVFYQGPFAVTTEILWFGFGVLAQAMFMGRFLVQWIASEKAKRSIVPMSFWYLSVLGGGMLFIYAVHREEPVFAFGQATGLLIYLRNIYFMHVEQRKTAEAAEAAATEAATRIAGAAPDPAAATPSLAGRGLRIALLVILGVTLWRLGVMAGVAPPLFGDEAQYWTWAQALAWGYYSKPPMVAWAIAGTTALCGDGEACVRLAAPLSYVVTALMLFLLGRRLFDARVAVWTAAVFITLPGVALSAVIISTDPLMLMFWSIALYAVWRATTEDGWRWWLLTGAAIGLGLLSKYTMIAFAGSLLLYLLLLPDQRRQLARARFWVMLLLAAALVAPNIWWNASVGFVTVGHILDNANLGGDLLRPEKLLEFLGTQFGVFGPILFGMLLYLLLRHRRAMTADPASRFLLAFVLPLLVVIALQALVSRAHANWAVAAYVAGTLLVSAWMSRLGWRPLLQVSIALHLVAAVAVYHGPVLAGLVGATLPARADPLNRLRGWDAVGAEIARLLRAHPGARPLFLDRMLMASALYYARPDARGAVKWNGRAGIDDQYELTTSLDGADGDDFLLITRYGLPDGLTARFASWAQLPDIHVSLYGDGRTDKHSARIYQVFLLRDFQG